MGLLVPTDTVNLEVHLPDERVVTVRVTVIPMIGLREDVLSEQVPVGVHALDPEQLVQREVFIAYLRTITTGESAGAVVRTTLLEPDLATLLDLLGIPGAPPDPIRVTVPGT